MYGEKTSVNVKAVVLTPDERLVSVIFNKNIPRAKIEIDENGNAFVDKELHPEIYDWAANG